MFSKAQQTRSTRIKPKRGDVTKVTPQVRQEVNRRSMELLDVDIPVCERCGTSKNLSKGHILEAAHMGPGSIPWNIMNLCGTHGWKDTCHDWADNTREGRLWKKQYGAMLKLYYSEGNGQYFWKYAA